MFLIKEKRKHGTNLCIVQSYRDPITKETKRKRIKNIGYLEELKKHYDDPVAHFEQVAKEMSEEYSQEKKPIQLSLDLEKKLDLGVDLEKNFGYAVLSSLYHELGLDVFFSGKQRELDIEYNLNSIMKLLVYGSILYPGTIQQIYNKKDKFFDKMDFSLNDVYESFTYFHRYKPQLQEWIHKRINGKYGHVNNKMYYYVTKHYFETNNKRRGCEARKTKEYFVDPIVQMGLFVETSGLPVSYELVRRNPGDALVISAEIKKRCHGLGAKKLIIVGDNGSNSTDGLYYARSSGNGYIVSQSVRDANQEIKDFVLDPEGYVPFGDGCMIKERICTKKIRVTTTDGKKKPVSYEEKQIVYHNEKYARCAMAERQDALMKAKDLIASPGKYTKETAYGAAKYVQNIEFNKKTGAIIQGKQPLHLDKKGLIEEKKYDGYYLFITSELSEDNRVLIDVFNGLWEVEESFKYVNRTYTAMPPFISREEHLSTHYLTSFVALVVTRILERKTNKKFSLPKIINSLKRANCVHIDDNMFAHSYYDSILESVGKSVGIDFSLRYGSLSKIKGDIGATKK